MRNPMKLSLLKLSQLQPGQRAKVKRILLSASARVRLMEMGLTTGAEFVLVRFAPLGDPLEIQLRGYHLSLRLQEAEGVEVESLPAS